MRSVTIAFLGFALIPLISADCPVCGGGYPDLEERVEAARVETVEWLASQQEVPGSWVSLNTQNAIFGLQLADPSWFANLPEGVRELTSSRLEYELMTYLLPWRTSRDRLADLGLSAGRLAQYMLALQSVQIPAEDFYGIDLHRLMSRFLKRSRSSFDHFFQYSFGILSQCSKNVTIGRGALKKLAFSGDKPNPCVTEFDGPSGHNLDILSLEVMAMVCARDHAFARNIKFWDRYLDAKVQCIIERQESEGNFGNDITTSLAVQALTAAGAYEGDWECVSAVEWLLDNMETDGDGSPGNVAGTAQIIPFLNCNNFGSLRTAQSPGGVPTGVSTTVETGHPVPPNIQPDDDTVTFAIEVRIGDDVESYSVTILENENLYYGMIRLQATADSGFTFESSDSAFGQSIDAINGVSDDADASLYWTIRVGDPDTYADAGIEGLFPTKGILYIFILTDFS